MPVKILAADYEIFEGRTLNLHLESQVTLKNFLSVSGYISYIDNKSSSYVKRRFLALGCLNKSISVLDLKNLNLCGSQLLMYLRQFLRELKQVGSRYNNLSFVKHSDYGLCDLEEACKEKKE